MSVGNDQRRIRLNSPEANLTPPDHKQAKESVSPTTSNFNTASNLLANIGSSKSRRLNAHSVAANAASPEQQLLQWSGGSGSSK